MKTVIYVEVFQNADRLRPKGKRILWQYLKLSEARLISKWIEEGLSVEATRFFMSPQNYKNYFGQR